MLKKIILFALGLLTGCVISSIIVMALYGYRLSRGMFMLQDMDIIMVGEAAREAYLSEDPEIGIWALENYLGFFNVVIEQRTTNQTTDEVEDFFVLATPGLRWTSYIRLGLLYEKVGNEKKRDESFQEAGKLFKEEYDASKNIERMIKFVNKQDEDFKPYDFEAKQE